ncbi:MAG: ECF transporter S component [Desulfurococcaceae archaeon TW002]
MKTTKFTSIDLALLAVTGVVSGVIFTANWTLYYVSEALTGPIGARVISYGLWFIGAPLAASLIKKPFSAFLGEFIGALVETLIAPAGGITNAIYGFTQGLASELGYMMFRYGRWDILSGAIAGALAGIPAVALDALLFGMIGGPIEMGLWVLAACVSGAIYGTVVSFVGLSIRR